MKKTALRRVLLGLLMGISCHCAGQWSTDNHEQRLLSTAIFSKVVIDWHWELSVSYMTY